LALINCDNVTALACFHRDYRRRQRLFAHRRDTEQQGWSPNFTDYLFLAFNTSTAFSPTDAPVLARWAKILMMLQSLLSLLIIALLAARAVNIL
jgi:hypothetical protein